MFTFENRHIFTGYLKQVLASFNLPKRINNSYPATTLPDYFYNKKIPNVTKNFVVKNNIYDTYTHEYLGDYLRFQRDYNRLNLMPLYNCFNNKIIADLAMDFTTKDSEVFKFSAKDDTVKTYSIPIKFGAKYTIAISSEKPIKICCGLYNVYQNKYYTIKYSDIDSDNQARCDAIQTFTYNSFKKYNRIAFEQPEIYQVPEKGSLSVEDEFSLKMFLQIPADNSSSIVILEGDYTNWQTSLLVPIAEQNKYKIANNEATVDTADHLIKLVRRENKYITNYEEAAIKKYDEDDTSFEPRTRLQLLSKNTGVSYPFADRLIEYILGMVIDHTDKISDDVARVQQVMHWNGMDFDVDGAWDWKIQHLAYDYITDSTKLNTYKNTDIFGYIDKTVEINYASAEPNKNKKTTIAHSDIYPDMYKDSKEVD